MEKWRTGAIAEAHEILELLLDDDFSREDLGDRLTAWVECLRLDPTSEPYEETDQ